MNVDPHPSSNNGRRGDSFRALERACDAAMFREGPSADDVLDARGAGVDLASEVETFEAIIGRLEAERFDSRRSEEAPMPMAVRDRLQKLADRHAAEFSASPPAISMATAARAREAASRRRIALRDWIVAAACIAFGAVTTLAFVRAGARKAPELPTDPTRFVSLYPQSVRWSWEPTKDDHVVGEVRGEAIFDPESSRGLLLIEGLAVNDPKQEQYQLWIFDAARDERYPVDGGVFDVPSCGHAVIPIQAKLNVTEPKLFAVTIERPGGVVVSDRRIAILAKP